MEEAGREGGFDWEIDGTLERMSRYFLMVGVIGPVKLDFFDLLTTEMTLGRYGPYPSTRAGRRIL